jgi:putative peptide zinc metalloprotease protein
VRARRHRSFVTLAELQGIDDRLVMDTSEKSPVFLLIGDNGSRLRISASARDFLQRIKGGLTFEQLAGSIRRSDGTALSAAEIEETYNALAEKIARFQAQASQPTGWFWLRKKLIPATFVAKVARVTASAYHPLVVVVVALAVSLSVVASLDGVARAPVNDFWAAYGVFLASILAHEFGHASACARFGAKPGEIGVVMFFIYPSFYSDVNAAWGLKRWQRVVVDLGGIYFQLLFGCGCLLAYAVSGWAPLRGTLLLIAASCLFSLNPLLKFDGYWVVADSLGVTNLARQPFRIIRHLVDRARGRVVRPLPWSSAICFALGLYSALAVAFWAWLLLRLVPSAELHFARWGFFATALWREALARSPTWPTTKGFFTSSFLLLFVFLMLFRIFGPLIGRGVRALRGARRANSEEEPA